MKKETPKKICPSLKKSC